jgi:hypothetical protein
MTQKRYRPILVRGMFGSYWSIEDRKINTWLRRYRYAAQERAEEKASQLNSKDPA